MANTISLGALRLVGETIGRGVFFPVWWYTRGLFKVWQLVSGSLRNQFENLGLEVWLKNLFVPMYGINDLAGRAISFLIRLFMIVVRGLVLIFWAGLLFIFIIFYLLLLPVSLLGFIYHLVGILDPAFYV
ncbi:MAG: hypothetical protein V1664_00670 [Candidatus Uhrbacteria bacterium]